MTIFMMVMVNPRILDFDVGFQLSFLATWGLLIFMSGFQNLKIKFIPEVFLEVFFSTLSALLLTVPVIMINFQHFSLISFPANLIVLPFISLLMLLGVMLWLMGFLFAVGTLFFGKLISFFTEFLINIVAVLAHVNFLTINMTAQWQLIWLIYYFFLFKVFYKSKSGRSAWWQFGIPDESVPILE